MSDTMLTDGSPVPADGSHKQLQANGQQAGYVVLSEEERRKGFVKPVRSSYLHTGLTPVMSGCVLVKPSADGCGARTSMGVALSETYARNPRFYSGTFCTGCSKHFPLNQFRWTDGEPMDPELQEAWGAANAAEKIKEQHQRKQARIAELRAIINGARSELLTLEES